MLEEPITKWLQYCRRYYTARTNQHYSMVLGQFKRFVELDGGQFTTQAVEGYVDDLLKRAVRRTANAYLTAVKSFSRWYAEYYHTDNPAAKVKLLKEDEPRQRVLTKEEYERILVVAKGVNKDIIAFLANTGLRKNEFRFLRWENISADQKYVHLQGKGRKQRLVPLNQLCRDILAQYRNGNDSGPIPFTQRYYGREGVYWLCKKLSKETGIERFGPHAIRHFFATRLMRQGVPLAKISKILGHASIKTTEQIYIHWLPKDVLGLTDCLPD